MAGPFSFEYSPYLREPCAWFCDPYVREITLMACLQGGKTLYSLLCMAWAIEHAPAHMMAVMTDENTMKRRMRRLRPTFAANPFLLRKLGGSIDNLHLGEPTDLPGMQLYLAWSNSAAAMADVPVCYIFADEVALWQGAVGVTQVDALSHLRGRQTTFERMSKLVKVSSPENAGDLMDTEFNDGDRCEYWVTCPHCGYSHTMKWYDSAEPAAYVELDKVKGEFLRPREYEMGRHARYRCPSCGKVWSDYARAAAVAAGRFLPAGVTMGRGGAVEGEIVPAAYKSARITGLMVHPRLRSLGKMASEWVRSQQAVKAGNVGRLKRFLNAQLGQSWKETRAETDEAKALEHRGYYPSGTAPVGVQAITVSIDVQVDHLRYGVWGWGYLYECWLIEAGRMETGDTKEIENYELARQLIVRPWPLAGTELVLPPAKAVIDCAYNTDVVLNFCRANAAANVSPVLGSPRVMSRTYARVPVDHIVTRYDLNLLTLKDMVHRLLFLTDVEGGGYLHLPGDVTPEIVGELCSEFKTMVKGRPQWVPKSEHRANHTWDLAVYGTFAAMLAGVGTLAPYVPPKPPKQRQPQDREEDDDFLKGLPKLN